MRFAAGPASTGPRLHSTGVRRHRRKSPPVPASSMPTSRPSRRRSSERCASSPSARTSYSPRRSCGSSSNRAELTIVERRWSRCEQPRSARPGAHGKRRGVRRDRPSHRCVGFRDINDRPALRPRGAHAVRRAGPVRARHTVGAHRSRRRRPRWRWLRVRGGRARSRARWGRRAPAVVDDVAKCRRARAWDAALGGRDRRRRSGLDDRRVPASRSNPTTRWTH